jgi:hypothetical protein
MKPDLRSGILYQKIELKEFESVLAGNPAANCLQNSSHPGKIEIYCEKRVD